MCIDPLMNPGDVERRLLVWDHEKLRAGLEAGTVMRGIRRANEKDGFKLHNLFKNGWTVKKG